MFYKKLNLKPHTKNEIFNLADEMNTDVFNYEPINKTIFYTVNGYWPDVNFYNKESQETTFDEPEHKAFDNVNFPYLVNEANGRRLIFDKYRFLDYFHSSFVEEFQYHRHVFNTPNSVYPYVLAAVNRPGKFKIVESHDYHDPTNDWRYAVENLIYTYQVLDPNVSVDLLYQDISESHYEVYVFHSWYWHNWTTSYPDARASAFVLNLETETEFINYIDYIESL